MKFTLNVLEKKGGGKLVAKNHDKHHIQRCFLCHSVP